jgi:gluconokinase
VTAESIGNPNVIVVMGVAGAGKTVVGRALAAALGWQFIEGDDFHSAANVDKMSHGIPLTDADRAPWLQALCDAIAKAIGAHEHVVVACSALKQAYRDALVPNAAPAGSVRFVFLDVAVAILFQRLAARTHHFAGPALLESQLATLERPRDALAVDGTRPPAEIVRMIRERIVDR